MIEKVPGSPDLFTDIEPPVRQKLIRAAVAAFGERGYHATRTRDISAGAGISASGMYVHFGSKEEVLFEIARLGHAATAAIIAETAETIETPAGQIATMVARLSSWHAHNTAVARVITNEMQALAPEDLDQIEAMRRDSHRLLQGAIEEGIKDGSFTVDEPFSASMAIVALFTDVSRWYSPLATRNANSLSQHYAGYALSLLGYTGPEVTVSL